MRHLWPQPHGMWPWPHINLTSASLSPGLVNVPGHKRRLNQGGFVLLYFMILCLLL